jgi:hypothetical protein
LHGLRPLGQSRAVDLELKGHPLHSRALGVTLRRREDGDTAVEGRLLDLRKRGFVPVGGDLQGPGPIHDMRVAAVVDPEQLELRRIEVTQPTVAFEPSAVTRGESCRDPAPRVQALVGERLDAGFAARLSAQIGGPRGCTHVLTLLRLLGAVLAWAREREQAVFGRPPDRAPGERIFRRDLVFDGSLDTGERGPRIALAAQLCDLHFRPAPALATPLERLAGQLELRLLAEVETPGLALAALRAAERRRALGDLEHAPWRALDSRVEGLAGLTLGPGVSGELLRRFAGLPDERRLLGVLLDLTPALYQCLACTDESWPVRASRSPTLLGMGGPPDSCYMWRRGGALDGLREREPEKEESP